MDDFLYHRYPCVLVLPSALFLLAYGRFLLGSDSYCLGRIREEGCCSCEYSVEVAGVVND